MARDQKAVPDSSILECASVALFLLLSSFSAVPESFLCF